MQTSACSNKPAPTFPSALASLVFGMSLEPWRGVLGPRAGLGTVGLEGEMGLAWAASWRKMRSLLRRIQRSSSLPSPEKLKLSSTGALGLRTRLPGLESSCSTLAGGSKGSSGAALLPCSRDGNFRILMSLSESVNSNSVPVWRNRLSDYSTPKWPRFNYCTRMAKIAVVQSEGLHPPCWKSACSHVDPNLHHDEMQHFVLILWQHKEHHGLVYQEFFTNILFYMWNGL